MRVYAYNDCHYSCLSDVNMAEALGEGGGLLCVESLCGVSLNILPFSLGRGARRNDGSKLSMEV